MKFDDLKFGHRGHDIGDNLESMCENAKFHGVSNIQFAMAKTMNTVNFDEIGYDRELSKNVKAKLSEYNLEVSVLGCYINPVNPDTNVRNRELKRFDNFIRYAHDFKAKVIGTETGRNGDDYAHRHSEEVYTSFINNIKPLVKTAEEQNVVIGIEPVWDFTIYSVERLKRMLDEIKSDSLGVIMDISNIMNPGNLYMQDKYIDYAFDNFGDKIKAVHVKDFVFADGTKHFAVCGNGMLHIKHLFDRISEQKNLPELILDEMPVSKRAEALANLKEIIG